MTALGKAGHGRGLIPKTRREERVEKTQRVTGCYLSTFETRARRAMGKLELLSTEQPGTGCRQTGGLSGSRSCTSGGCKRAQWSRVGEGQRAISAGPHGAIGLCPVTRPLPEASIEILKAIHTSVV